MLYKCHLNLVAILQNAGFFKQFAVDIGPVFTAKVFQQGAPGCGRQACMETGNLPVNHNHVTACIPPNQDRFSDLPALPVQWSLLSNQDRQFTWICFHCIFSCLGKAFCAIAGIAWCIQPCCLV